MAASVNSVATSAANNLVNNTSGVEPDRLTKLPQDDNVNDLVKVYFDNLNAKNYSQCAVVLKDSRLKQETFITETLIEGMVISHQLYAEAHLSMQIMTNDVMIEGMMQKLSTGQEKFEVELAELSAKRETLVKAIETSCKERTQRIEAFAIKAFQDPNISESKCKIAIESLVKLNENFLVQLKDSQLSQKAFIVVGIEETMIANGLSNGTHLNKQAMMADIMQKLLAGSAKFEGRLCSLQAKEVAWQKAIQTSLDQSIQRFQDVSIKWMFDPNVTEGKYKVVIENLEKLNKTFLKESTKLVESQGINKEFFDKAHRAHKQIFDSLQRVVAAGSKEEINIKAAFIKARKEMVLALIEDRELSAAAGEQAKKPVLLSANARAAAGAGAAGIADGLLNAVKLVFSKMQSF